MSGSLGLWQAVSLLSRSTALFLGLIQSVIIARILTVSEFGLIGIVSAVGAMAGIAQHLGLASGTTRQISATSEKNEVFKVFISSVAIKYLVTFPIALGLFILAPFLAENVYKHPQITFSLRLYAIVLVIGGVQSIFNSVIAGLQKFKHLFLYQAGIALVSVFLYVPLVFLYRVDGYFIALTLFNIISTLTLGALSLYPIRKDIKRPTAVEFKIMFKNIFVLSLGIYFVKVLYTVWVRFGQLALPYYGALESVGIFSFAMLYASKLQTISDALTDVNLPFFSKEFTRDFDSFKKSFHDNFDRLYSLVFFAGLSGIYFSKEIILFAVGDKYAGSFFIITPLVASFIFYSFINILKSSVLIPAKMIFEMILGFASMLLISVLTFILLASRMDPVTSVSLSMALGGLFGFVLIGILVYLRLKFTIVGINSLLISIIFILMLFGHLIIGSFIARFLYFGLLCIIFVYALDRLRIVSLTKLVRRLF